MFSRLDALIRSVCIATAVLGGFGLLVATGVTCLSILMKLARRMMEASEFTPEALAWVRPILGEEELVQYAVGLAICAALPFVMYAKGHITIDLFSGVFGGRLNRLLDLLGDTVLAVLAYLLFTRQWTLLFKPARRDDATWMAEFLSGNWAELGDRLRDNQESQILGIKLWPTYAMLEFLTAMFLVVALFCVLRSARAVWHQTDQG